MVLSVLITVCITEVQHLIISYSAVNPATYQISVIELVKSYFKRYIMAQARRAIYSLVVHNQQTSTTCGLSNVLFRSAHSGAPWLLSHLLQQQQSSMCSQQPASIAAFKYSQSTRSLSSKIQTEVSISNLLIKVRRYVKWREIYN